MRRPLSATVVAATTFVGGVVAAAAFGTPASPALLRTWVAFAGALALLAAVRSITNAGSGQAAHGDRRVAVKAPRVWWHRPTTQRPPRPITTQVAQVRDLCRAIDYGMRDAWGVHSRLRPVLRSVVRERLGFRGVDIDADPVAAALVEPELWEVVRADRPSPRDRDQPGCDPAQIARLLDAVDAL